MEKEKKQINQNSLVRLESEKQEKRRIEKEEKIKRKIIIGAYSQNEVNEYQESLDAAKRMNFIVLLPAAIISDFADFVPFVGTFTKFIALSIIWYSYYIKGTTVLGQDPKYKIEVSWKVRFLFRALGVVDIIPLINSLPLTTLSVILIWHQLQKEIKNKEEEMSDWENQKEQIFR